MSVLVTKEAPNFQAQAVLPDGSFQKISLTDYRGKHVLLFFYPLDFTFVCPTEIITFDKHTGDFKDRNTEVLACSIDSQYSCPSCDSNASHARWRTLRSKSGCSDIAICE